MNIELELMSSEIAKVIMKFLEITEPNIGKKVDRTAIEMLKEIKTAVCDENLTDFDIVEKIVCLLEKNNISCGSRHNF